MSGEPGRIRSFFQRLDKDPRLVKLLRLGRSRLPGDDQYGDPLSLTGDRAPAVLGRRLSALTAERPGALREVGMSALQVWQGLSEAQGRGRGDRELAIVFTDLAGCSTWALDAGDRRPARSTASRSRVTDRSSAPASTPGARAASAATTSASTSTSPRASPRRRGPARCSSRRPCTSASSATASKRRWRFSAKGAPKGLKVYAAEPS